MVEKSPLRVLLVEDSLADAELLIAELERHGYEVHYTRVETEAEMRRALDEATWDVVLSDFSLPTFSAPAALKTLRSTGQNLPFIIVSGTIGEEAAVAALKAGAHDFLNKGKLARLIPALERERREADARRERQWLEEQLRQSQKLEAIGRMASGIAHDFNNMLTTIAGYSEMVLDQIGPDKPISADLFEIRRATDRAAQLTRQLLAFSRQQVLRLGDLDLNEIVVGMRGMLQRLIDEDIVVDLKLADTLPSIRGDRIQLEQVLLNVAVNARDAMPNGGRFLIETGISRADDVAALTGTSAAPRSYVRLTMRDTGSGMDEATRKRLFEPFFTTKEIGKGTGLGLATVYGIVQQLEGYIGVTSAVGKGSAFNLFFPALETSQLAEAASSETAQAVSPIAAQHETILLVEDEPGVRRLVTRTLTRHGYQVLEASTAAEGLAFVAERGPAIHLVLADVVMAEMTGLEMVGRIRKNASSIKVLFMSGHTGQALKQGAKLDASDHLLEKPFYAHDLLKAVRDVLDRVPV